MIVNQWLPAAHRGDAIGDNARRVRGFLREDGHSAEIYALHIDDDLAGDVLPLDRAESCRGDVTIFHFALASPMTARFSALTGSRRILHYHDITPAHFFEPYDAGLHRLAALGRQELASLAGHVDLALADSDYSRRELEQCGFNPTGVMPIAVDTRRVACGSPRPALEDVLGDGLCNFLFVGRIAPNKRIEDHIRLAEHYRHHVDNNYRFLFVGRTDAVPRYYAALRGLMAEYRMPADRCVFTGPAAEADLGVYYRSADVYISLSEHEGFCAPLVEAMAADVPVLAYAAAAVPETLGGAGVQFAPKDLEHAAELLYTLAVDEQVRADVIAGQRRRLRDFTDTAVRDRLRAVLAR
jgi:glycosyltransferase involved in cell wall biosynthesis